MREQQRLNIYLDDHLALLVGELELARRCKGNNAGTKLGDFLTDWIAEVQAQQTTARSVLQAVGGKESTLKNGAAWIAEKLGRFKLNDAVLHYSDLSRLLELEGLAMAAQERLALWETLDVVAAYDLRLADLPFAALRDQTTAHLARLALHRKDATLAAFAPLEPRPPQRYA